MPCLACHTRAPATNGCDWRPVEIPMPLPAELQIHVSTCPWAPPGEVACPLSLQTYSASGLPQPLSSCSLRPPPNPKSARVSCPRNLLTRTCSLLHLCSQHAGPSHLSLSLSGPVQSPVSGLPRLPHSLRAPPPPAFRRVHTAPQICPACTRQRAPVSTCTCHLPPLL